MPIITAKVNTIIRSLDGVRAINIKAGKSIACTLLPHKNQLLIAKFEGDDKDLGIKRGDEYTIYSPSNSSLAHWILPDEWKHRSAQPSSIKLGVPFYAQNDTRSDGWRYCFSHAVAMAAFYLNPKLAIESKKMGFSQPEQYYISKLPGDTTDPVSHIVALRKFGFTAYYSQTISPRDLYGLLNKGIPVPIGVSYKVSGHWVTVVGFDGPSWIVHDPYGIRNGSSDYYVVNGTDQNKHGAFDVYSAETMNQIYWDLSKDERKEAGYGIVFTAVNGTSLEVPTGL